MTWLRVVHARTSRIADLVHAMSVDVEAWYTFCEPYLPHSDFPGEMVDKGAALTCIICASRTR